MALEKDKERPTSPKQRASMQSRSNLSEGLNVHMSVGSNNDMKFKTEQQYDVNNMRKSNLSESPINAGRNYTDYANKNMLLSPGGQLNNFNTGVRREDSMSSNTMIPPLSKHDSENTASGHIHRLSKASSISSSTNYIQTKFL